MEQKRGTAHCSASFGAQLSGSLHRKLSLYTGGPKK